MINRNTTVYSFANDYDAKKFAAEAAKDKYCFSATVQPNTSRVVVVEDESKSINSAKFDRIMLERAAKFGAVIY